MHTFYYYFYSCRKCTKATGVSQSQQRLCRWVTAEPESDGTVAVMVTVMVTCLQEKTEKSGKRGWPSHRTRWPSWRRSSSGVTTRTSTPGSSWRRTWASPRAAYRWERQLADIITVSVNLPHFHSFILAVLVSRNVFVCNCLKPVGTTK